MQHRDGFESDTAMSSNAGRDGLRPPDAGRHTRAGSVCSELDEQPHLSKKASSHRGVTWEGHSALLEKQQGSGGGVDAEDLESVATYSQSDADSKPAARYRRNSNSHAPSVVSASTVDSDITEETTTSAASSAAQAARNAGITRIKVCGKTIRISFVAWTLIAMAVPVVFLIGSTAWATDSAMTNLSNLRRYVDLARTASECATVLGAEEVLQGRNVVRNSQLVTEGLADTARRYEAACVRGLQRELVSLADDDAAAFEPSLLEWLDGAGRVAEARRDNAALPLNATAEQRVAALEQVLTAYDTSARAATNALVTGADRIGTADGRRLMDIKMSADMRSAVYSAAAAGFLLVNASTRGYTLAVYELFVRRRESQRSAVRTLLELGTKKMRAEFRSWRDDRSAAAAFALLDATLPQLQRTGAEAWYETTTTAVRQLETVEKAHVAALEAADDAHAKAATALTIMATGIAACAVAAALLVWQQLRTKGQLEDQVMRAERTRKAVSAFVPKFFLSKMGYTSITQVQVGESTDVALAMLFSDVRQFTRVSEGMASAALFQWVQGYFRRMTTIVEANRGNINQFIGDALFAVFSSCADSVACAVEMQSDAQQLNIERLCEDGNSVPIEIGVGLHHDVLAMGILGDAHRHTCTAISASVNLASRLEGLTKQLGCRILASEAVMTQLSEAQRGAVAHRRIGPAVVKGSSQDVVIYDVFQTDERDLQAYKLETKEDFERYARMALVADGDKGAAADHDVATARLQQALETAAMRRGVVDHVLAQLLKFRDPNADSMAFDEK